MIGIYFHIPFCKSKCPYCDFYSTAYAPDRLSAYQAALEREMERYRGVVADTLYFGGGTPSLLSGSQFSKLIDAARDCFLLWDAEITTEANPAELSYSYLEELQKAGINRLSIGIQSLSEKELSYLGRRHTAKEALSALRRARKVGCTNLSVDLMLGIPEQTPESLRRTLSLLEPMELTHLSADLVTIEPNTPFGRTPPPCPGEEETADLYLTAVEQLETMGLAQYEISNFARPGYSCRHNLKYWTQEPYLGFGSSSHSFWKGERRYHPADVDDYLHRPERTIFLEPGGDPEEWLTLRLRLREGVLWDQAEKRGFSIELLRDKTRRLIQEGLAFPLPGRTALTPKGMLLSNAVILSFLE